MIPPLLLPYSIDVSFEEEKMKQRPHLLLVDDDVTICETLRFVLAKAFTVSIAHNRQSAVQLMRTMETPPVLALVDLGLPPVPHKPDEGFALIEDLLVHSPSMKIIVLSGQNQEAYARHARTLGAVDFIAKPCDPKQIIITLEQALLVKTIEEHAADECIERLNELLLGNSPPIQKLRDQIHSFAASPFSVLIEGESGSGKERVAMGLHEAGPQSFLPMLSLNCAAISPGLVESTLFGYAKGAYTGASHTRAGYFEEVGEGVLFLDEIGEMPLEVQSKLLRVLENGEYYRVGETQVRKTAARVVAATNRDLRQDVKDGRFRADLYHRLSVLTIQVPPLRTLGHDRLLLLNYFLQEYSTRLHLAPFSLTKAATQVWLDYHFPGNVRELRNIVIRLLTKYAGCEVNATALQADFSVDLETPSLDISSHGVTPEFARLSLQSAMSFDLDEWLHHAEQVFIQAALEINHGSMSQTAKMLGVNRTTLYSRVDLNQIKAK